MSHKIEIVNQYNDTNNKLIRSFKDINIFKINIADIQPSQFYVDKNKVEAVSYFYGII